MNIAVYCSSSDTIAEKYFETARSVGQLIAEAGHTLFYGGTFMGLMGAVAKANEAHGGKRVGVICQKIYEMKDVVIDKRNLLITSSLNERKAKLAELADMHLVLAGGFGTLDEALSILAMKQVGESDAPVVFLNTDGFYEDLQQQFATYYQENFASDTFQKSYRFLSDVADLKGVLLTGK